MKPIENSETTQNLSASFSRASFSLCQGRKINNNKNLASEPAFSLFPGNELRAQRFLGTKESRLQNGHYLRLLPNYAKSCHIYTTANYVNSDFLIKPL